MEKWKKAEIIELDIRVTEQVPTSKYEVDDYIPGENPDDPGHFVQGTGEASGSSRPIEWWE